jgi:hypothetical protein
MSERVRIEYYEAEDVERIVEDFMDWRNWHMSAEDLVNAIGEVYERALARRHQHINAKLIEAEATSD